MTKQTLAERFEKKWTPEPNTGCWLWTANGYANGGYGMIRVSSNSHDRSVVAHRVSWMLHKGPIPNGMFVCHKCDVRACVNPDHLFLGTAKDNMQDASRKGRMNWRTGEKRNLPTGEMHPAAKLTEENIRYIRSSSLPGAELARRLNVSNANISRIRRRVIWRNCA